MKNDNLIGVKFGRLTAIEKTNKKQGSAYLWVFRCDCGEIVEKNMALVKFGSTRSCGCLKKDTTSKLNGVDLTGGRFYRLTAINKIGIDKNGAVLWKCLCSCGKETTATTTALNKGSKRSCGCLQKEIAAKSCRDRKQENPISRTKEYRNEMKKRRLSDPEKYLQSKISRLVRFAIDGVGCKKNFKTFEWLGYTALELRLHIERQFTSGMSWENKSEWQIDHIIPCSTAKDENDVWHLNQLSNLRPLWAKENNAKKNKIEFLI